MWLVADESVDFGIIQRLRLKGINVISISEKFSGIKDTEVIKIAAENKCILVTEDKDFGELTYRLKYIHSGILLVRLNDMARNERIEFVPEIIEKHFPQLQNNFSVLSKNGLRIKPSVGKF